MALNSIEDHSSTIALNALEILSRRACCRNVYKLTVQILHLRYVFEDPDRARDRGTPVIIIIYSIYKNDNNQLPAGNEILRSEETAQ